MNKVLIEKTVLEDLYIKQGKTIRAIALELGRDSGTVHGQLRAHNIPTRKTGLQRGQRITAFHRSQISKSKMGDKNPSWRGGRVENKGYIYLHRPMHPFADSQGYVAEHRLVMEKCLGRLLRPTEVVHHINENPSDNRNENLKLFSSAGFHRQHHRRLERQKSKEGAR